MSTRFKKIFGPSLIGVVPALLLVFCGAGFAASNGLVVNADKVLYDQQTGTVEATGHVEAFYKNIRMTADRMTADAKTGDFHLIGNIGLTQDEFTLRGRQLDYNVKDRTGIGAQLGMQIGHMKINSKAMTFYPRRVELVEASLTTCQETVPHYKMGADRMTFYSKSGWAVFQNGLLYIKDVPVLWIPTYVYDVGAPNDRRHSHPAPIPDIQSNALDGLTIEEKTLLRLTDYSYGMVRTLYSANHGFGLGLETNYFINDTNEGRIRGMVWGNQGSFGGITHIFSFGNVLKGAEERQLVYEVLQTPAHRNYELFTELSWRERVNFERVSILPNIMLRVSEIPFGIPRVTWSGELSYANIMEESTNLQKSRARGILEGAASVLHDDQTDVSAGVNFNLAEYDLKSQWSQIEGTFKAARALKPSTKIIGNYEHYFLLQGASPFRFENYQYFASDGAGVRLEQQLWSSHVAAEIQYNLPGWTQRELNLEAGVGFDCFELLGTWQFSRGVFLLGMNLLN